MQLRHVMPFVGILCLYGALAQDQQSGAEAPAGSSPGTSGCPTAGSSNGSSPYGNPPKSHPGRFTTRYSARR